MMAAKISAKENKVFTMNATKLQKVLLGYGKVHESGRGEVSRFELEIFSISLVTFTLFSLIDCLNES